MDIKQHRHPESLAGRRQRITECAVIGAMRPRDTRHHLIAAQPMAPQFARCPRTARDKAKAAAHLVADRPAGRPVVESRIAILLGTVQVDPGARGVLDDHGLHPSGRLRDLVHEPVFQPGQRA